MAEAPGDWKVAITLDRKLLIRDIDAMVHILARQRMSVLVSASSPACTHCPNSPPMNSIFLPGCPYMKP